jgi:glycosyltransferase involved in cell wall biosynthesis
MRILAITTSYPLREGMAAGVFVQKLYSHLSKDWAIEVLCPDDDAKTTDGEAFPPVTRVRYAPRRCQKLGQRNGGILPALRANRWLVVLVPLLLAAMTLATLRRASRARVIHANWSVCGVIGVFAGRLVGVKVVTTLRGEDTTGVNKPRWTNAVLSACVRYSDAIVCVSEAMAHGLKHSYPKLAGKIRVIHNGVDDSLFDLPRPEPSEDCLRLLAIGSVIRRKGLDVLLAALATMETSRAVELVIAGDGPERERLATLANRLPATKKVTWLGEVAPAEVPNLLSGADVLVLSSRSEGRPNVVLEALAAGVPVISTRLPGVAGLVEDGVSGWLVDVEDAAGMARALEAACDLQMRVSFGNTARQRAKSRNETWDGAAASYALLFASLVDQRREAL